MKQDLTGDKICSFIYGNMNLNDFPEWSKLPNIILTFLIQILWVYIIIIHQFNEN